MSNLSEIVDSRPGATGSLELFLGQLLDEPLEEAFRADTLSGELPAMIGGCPVTLSVGSTETVSERVYRLAVQRATPLLAIRTGGSPTQPQLFGDQDAINWALNLAGRVPHIVVAIPQATPSQGLALELADADFSVVLQSGDGTSTDHLYAAYSDHTVSPTEGAILVREFLEILSVRSPDQPVREATGPGNEVDLLELVPFEIDGRYSMDDVVDAILDADHSVAFRVDAALEVITVLARLGGYPIGLVANRPAVGNGRITSAGCQKIARLVRLCDAYHVPLVFLVDTEGLAEDGDDRPSLEIVEATVKATLGATVPKVTVIIGRAYGLGALVMAAVAARADYVAAWPRAELALLAPEEVPASPGSPTPTEMHKQASVMRAARIGAILDIVHPAATRSSLATMLELLRGGNRYNRVLKESSRA